jgi:hypothetical protein
VKHRPQANRAVAAREPIVVFVEDAKAMLVDEEIHEVLLKLLFRSFKRA